MSAAPPGYAFLLPWRPAASRGVDQVVLNLARVQREEGVYEPVVLFPAKDETELGPLEVAGIPCLGLALAGLPPRRPGPAAWLGATVRLAPALLRLRRVLATRRVAVVNAHFASPLFALPLALRATGLWRGRVILSLHGVDVANLASLQGAPRRLWNRMAARADAVVAVSGDLARLAAAAFPAAAPRIATVLNAVDVAGLARAVDRAYVLPHGLEARRFVLHVGTFEAKKGQDVLLRAFARLAPDHPDVDLVLVGRPAETYEATCRLRDGLGLGARAVIVDGVAHAQVPRFLERALVYCQPSRAEPFGLAIVEAAAFGRPVVASAVGGIPEIIQDGVSGLLVPPDDVPALEAALRRMLSDEALRARLAAALSAHVRSDAMTWQRAWRQYRALAERPAIRAP